MDWIRLHPYTATILVVVILFLGGAIFVSTHAPVAPVQNSLTWSSGAPVPGYQVYTVPSPTPQQIAQEVIQPQALSTLSLSSLVMPTTTSANPSPSNDQGADGFDYLGFLAQLSGNTSVSNSSSSNDADSQQAISNAYQFVPTGLVATTAPPTKPMTASQKVIYEYGNDVGGEIQSFESLHTNQAQILKDQAEDRSDPAKDAAVVSLGQAFASVGTYMDQMQEVPDSASSLHAALAQSYKDTGAQLQVVGTAQSDPAFLQAIEKYDETANTFVKNYGALAQFFGEYGVTFSPSDPGSVFSFTETGGVSSGGL